MTGPEAARAGADVAGQPIGAAEQARRDRLVRELALDVGRLLLEAARETPPPWPEPDPTEDLDEPAILRKERRRKRRGEP